MAKKKKIDLKQVIADALEHYHKMKPSIKDSTKRQNESLLSEFYRFVDTLPARDRTMKIFSQKGLNRYKEYLIDKMERSKTDGKKRNFGVGQLNRCGSMIARLINNVLKPEEVVPNHVDWMKVEDTRREDQKGHFPLLDNEVTAIENCSGLTPAEEEYRDIFLLQIECGQRVSDLANILTGEYTLGQVDEYECIILATKKEDVPAAVVLTPKVRMLLERIKTHKHVDPKEFKDMADGKGNNKYNEAIRRITKKAGLDRIIVKIDTNKIVEKKPLYEVITSHDARSTFITNKIRAGMTPDDIAVFTGHVNGEMIRRVYAQPTIEDKLRNVKQYLSGGENEKDANSHANTLSNNPKEHNADVPADVLLETGTPKDFDPKTFLETNEYIAYDNYIRGLNDIVDRTINEMNAFQLFDEDDNENILQIVQNAFIVRIDELKQRYETQKLESQTIESLLKKVILDCWRKAEVANDPEFMESASEYYDNPKLFADLFQLSVMRTVIDYSRKNHIGEDEIESLEEEFHAICEEKPDAYFTFRVMPHYEVIWPIIKFLMVVIKMEQFIQENRPIVDDTMIKEDNRALKKVDWRLVFRELQKTPAMALETLIQNTKCGGDVKSVLYNSVKEGDFESFNKTIIIHEHEVRILINHSYSNQYFRMFAQTVDYLFKESTKGVENPIEMINRYIEATLLQYPFVDKDLDESTPDFLKKDIKEIDIKELLLWDLDGLLKAFDDKSKYFLYPSEKKIFNKVLSIVDFNKHPELKEAYDEYKAKQKAVTNQTDVEATIVSEEDKGNKRKSIGTRVNYLPVSIRIQNLDVDKLIRLLTKKDELNKNQQFITVLESTDNVDVATCLRHFLGTPSNTPLSFKLKWNGHTKVSLKFLIRLITNTNKEASRSNVIDESNREGISPEFVSQWTGSGELWAPVCEVFGGSPDYMMSVGLGKKGSPAREINLEQYNTIADIYFACKK